MDAANKKALITKLFEGTLAKKYSWNPVSGEQDSYQLSFPRSTILIRKSHDPFEDEPSHFIQILSAEGNVVEALDTTDFIGVVEDPYALLNTMTDSIHDQVYKVSETINDILKNL
jgi:hypothetical protein